jgi:hypothetical protein
MKQGFDRHNSPQFSLIAHFRWSVRETICFGQHYTQTNLVSNADGAARVTDPQLINP